MAVLHQVSAADAAEWRARAISHLTETRTRAEDRPLSHDDAAVLPDPGGEFWLIDPGADGEQPPATSPTTPGWLWCVETNDGAVLGDLVLQDATQLPDVWQSIVQLAGTRGWQRLSFSAFRHDPVTTALAEHADSRLVATKMQLSVRDAPSPDGLVLEPMDEQRYEDFHQRSMDLYTSELLASGSITDDEEARRASAAEMARLLPDGPATPDQLLFSAYAAGVRADGPVGEVWIALQPHQAFLYDIMVEPDRRGHGLGTQMLRAAAAVARTHGRTILGLNVFGNNAAARRLYERSGFVTTESIRSVDLWASTTMPHGTGSSSGSAT